MSAVRAFWDYLLECSKVKSEWKMPNRKIVDALKYLEGLFGAELSDLLSES